MQDNLEAVVNGSGCPPVVVCAALERLLHAAQMAAEEAVKTEAKEMEEMEGEGKNDKEPDHTDNTGH